MKVIGTAGHIDHGKSTLVYRLTGIDPDRLAEEKARGLTIDLGFAWMRLPSGTEVSVVDVPGHERFVRNMLAGAAGVDVGLLVVAADEAVMPQTREHVDILDLLGVSHAVVALTKADLVDQELLTMAGEDVAELLADTTLEGSPVIPVSAVTGHGIDALLGGLDHAVAVTAGRDLDSLPFLPIDRAFTVEGFGTVVTGTLHSGRLEVGQELELLPSGKRVRVRGLQTHKHSVGSADAGARVAANLAGVVKEEVGRGEVLALPDTVEATNRFDTRIRVVRDAPFALESGTHGTIHAGAAEIGATIFLLDAPRLGPGQEGWARVRTRQRLALVRGQRFIFRLPAPGRTIAGGSVIDLRPARGIERAKRLGLLRQMSDRDLAVAAAAVTGRGEPVSETEVARRLSVPLREARRTLESMVRTGEVVRLGRLLVDLSSWETLKDDVQARLQEYHREHPTRSGISKEELRRKLRWPGEAWPETVRALAEAGIVTDAGVDVALPTHQGGTHSRRSDAERVLRVLSESPFSPPSGHDLVAATGADPTLLAAMCQEGSIVRLGDNLFLRREAYSDLVHLTLRLIETEGQVTVARIRDEARTSRKYALAFLEHLDGQRITRRQGDARVRGARAPACV